VTHSTETNALDWRPALDHPDLLASATAQALTDWAAVRPEVAAAVQVAPIDPGLADTAALVAAYGLDPTTSVNCVLVAGRRGETERLAAAMVPASTKADVNHRIRTLLEAKKASFLPTDRAVADSGMEYGGITPIGLPGTYRVLVDARVDTATPVVIGSGVRRSKLFLPGWLLAALPGAEIVTDLAV
jgi:prolyl-tRNA editing enzyme YbaK/EbsC (Cys-tRNA(Pro) deacylase)